jgi:uncharacterized protein YqeY
LPSEADLQKDLQSAMRARDMAKVYVLRGVIAAIKNAKVDKQVKELPEAEVVALMRKEVAKRVETIEFAEKAGRAETAEQNRAEKAILDAYLPSQMDAAQLEQAIRSLSQELGTTQIGPLMAALRQRYAGNYDGKLASELIKKLSV